MFIHSPPFYAHIARNNKIPTISHQHSYSESTVCYRTRCRSSHHRPTLPSLLPPTTSSATPYLLLIRNADHSTGPVSLSGHREEGWWDSYSSDSSTATITPPLHMASLSTHLPPPQSPTPKKSIHRYHLSPLIIVRYGARYTLTLS